MTKYGYDFSWHELIPWGRVLELIVTQLIQKYPAFGGTESFITLNIKELHMT
jgi:hypothetical protein